MTTPAEVFAAYQTAEAIWHASLVATFGLEAGDARYQERGSMVKGYAEYCKARDAWELAYQRSRDERNHRQSELEDALDRERWDG